MPLKRASEYFVGQQACYNPLWQRISQAFVSTISLPAEEAAQNPRLYVTERVGQGITDSNLQQHLIADSTRLFVVQGPAGVGKTTLLHHVIRSFVRDQPDRALVWVDVLRIAARPDDPEDLYRAVEESVARQLDDFATDKRRHVARWLRFLVESWTDGAGECSIILERLRSGETLGGALLERLQRIVVAARFLDMTRVRLRYLRHLGRKPVIVIDNVDRLSSEFQRKLFPLAMALAAGSGEHPDDPDHAVGIMAMRPETVSNLEQPREGVSVFLRGNVCPPQVAPLLKQRIDYFLEAWKAPIVRSTTVLSHGGRAADLKKYAQSPDELPDAVARRLVQELAGALTASSQFGTQAERLQILASYNNRLVLMALAGYVASGHHEWDAWVAGDFSPAAVGATLHRQRVFKALLLGTRALYSSRASWAFNVFSDGNCDLVGGMITLRILKQLVILNEGGGIVPQNLALHLMRLFDYPVERSLQRIADLRTNGLIEEAINGAVVLSEAGDSYLKSMTRDFEYLQHVLIDTWVDSRYLVECRERDEQASLRFQRVLRFAQWMREMEVGEYCLVLQHREEALYRECYGEDTISATLASTLVRVLPTLPQSDQWSAGPLDLKGESQRLERMSSLEEIQREAKARVRAG